MSRFVFSRLRGDGSGEVCLENQFSDPCNLRTLMHGAQNGGPGFQAVLAHQRNSMKYIAAKNQKAFMADLKCVYKAATLNAAETALDELEAKWGDKYPLVIASWRNKWPTPTKLCGANEAFA